MANENDHSGAAFPQEEFWDEKKIGAKAGMTRREYFAAHAPEAPTDFDFVGEPAPEQPNKLGSELFNGRYVDLEKLAHTMRSGGAPAAAKVYGEEPVRVVQDHLKRRAEYDAANAAWANRQLVAREVAWRYAYADAMVLYSDKKETAPVHGFQDPLVKLHIHDLREALQEALRAMHSSVSHLEACEAGKIVHPFKSTSLPLLRSAIEKAGRVS